MKSSPLFGIAHVRRFHAKQTREQCPLLYPKQQQQQQQHLQEVVSSNLLILSHSKHGRLEEAKRVFDKLGPRKNAFSWNAMITAYAKNGYLGEARALFDATPHRNVVSWNTMVSAYAKMGHLREAAILFEAMPERDVVTWTALVSGYAEKGLFLEALGLYNRMNSDGVKPDRIAAINVLDICVNMGDRGMGGGEEECERVYESLRDSGFDLDVVVGTALIKTYGRIGRIYDARDVFDRMANRNVVSWNTLITAYVHNGHLDEAHKLFLEMPDRNVVSWTALITGYARSEQEEGGRGEEKMMMKTKKRRALELLEQMTLKECIKPNNVTFISALDVCASLAEITHGKMIHSSIVQFGFELDTALGNALVNMYGKCGRLDNARHMFTALPLHDSVSWTVLISSYASNGCLEHARSVFDHMPERNAVAWTVMIAAYNDAGQGIEALGLFRRMEQEGVKMDKVTFTSILETCASLEDLQQGKTVHARIASCRLESEYVSVQTALVNMYGKCRSLQNAAVVFAQIGKRTSLSWNAIIVAYAQSGQGKGALELFEQMIHDRAKPNKITYINILDTCANLASIKRGKVIHASIVTMGLESDYIVGNVLINMYGKCGSMEHARSMFDKMAQRDVISWTTMIVAYAQNGQGVTSLEIFRQMNSEGVKPNAITFINVLTACTHVGLLDDAWSCFHSMYRDHGITPTLEHYVCMMNILGRAGHLDEVEGFLDCIPFEPPFELHAVAWMCLLGTCKMKGDVSRGTRAAEHIFELGPEIAKMVQVKKVTKNMEGGDYLDEFLHMKQKMC